MAIETKFSLGQKIWWLGRALGLCEHCGSRISGKEWRVYGPEIIDFVSAAASLETTRQNPPFYATSAVTELLTQKACWEPDFFATEAEAQAEAAKRNADTAPTPGVIGQVYA